MCTLSKVQKIRAISRGSKNTFNLLQWLSMRKQILKHKKIKKIFVPKIILPHYRSSLHKDHPTYVDLRMDLIYTYFPTGSRSPPCAILEICEYLGTGKRSSLFFMLHFLCFKLCFLIDNHCKRSNVFSNLLKITRIFWSLLRVVYNTFNILQRLDSKHNFVGVSNYAYSIFSSLGSGAIFVFLLC